MFISYSRKDIDSARKLTEAFKGQELDFWIDWEGIPPTVVWWKEIEKGIEEADIFLFLLSPDSVKSPVCKQEIEYAVKNGKRLIPLVVRELKADKSPSELRELNWIFCRASDDFDRAFEKLIIAIKTDYEWVQEHRQLQVKALDWQRHDHESSFLLRGKELEDAEFQLATNTSKEPHPTDLQREYVFSSRQATDKQRRTIIDIAIGGAIVMAALAVFGFVQARLAQQQRDIAIARQLAAQAQSIYATGNSKQVDAVLLAIQSMRMLPSFDAAQILQNNTLAYRVSERLHAPSGTLSEAFSSDGKYVVFVNVFGNTAIHVFYK